MYSDSFACYLTYLLGSRVPLAAYTLSIFFFSLFAVSAFSLVPHCFRSHLETTKRAQLGILFLWTTSHQEIRLRVWKATPRVASFHSSSFSRSRAFCLAMQESFLYTHDPLSLSLSIFLPFSLSLPLFACILITRSFHSVGTSPALFLKRDESRLLYNNPILSLSWKLSNSQPEPPCNAINHFYPATKYQSSNPL